MNKFWNLLKSRQCAGIFGIISLLFGFFFFNNLSITGNAVFSSSTNFKEISTIGIILMICSIILLAYALKKK